MELHVRNVNQGLSEGLRHLHNYGIPEPSRYGDVLVSPDPVMTVYSRPLECVLFSPLRNANPFFHLLGDALWLLAGRNDIKWPCYFNSRFMEFSDDGIIAPGAYGFRWREYFGVDQLDYVVKELSANPNSRRAVLQMWHPEDFARLLAPGGTKDAPCNLNVMFDCRGDVLNMTVTCRSNDIWWGCYGANAVQFAVLMEYIAAWLKVPVGIYRQFSNNFHVYTNIVPKADMLKISADATDMDLYRPNIGAHFPLISVYMADWENDLDAFINRSAPRGGDYRDPFFTHVAEPMYRAWHDRKEGVSDGMAWAKQIGAWDWRRACVDWITRAEARKAAKESV